MNKKIFNSKLFVMFIALMIAFAAQFGTTNNVSAQSNEAQNDKISIFISFEGFNLGQGFYIEPTEIVLPAGSTAEDATRHLLEKAGHTFSASGTGSTFYLSRVDNFDTGIVNPPPFITEQLGSGSNDGSLGEFDYTFSSGWMITINHAIIATSAGAYQLNDQDVIRWQFTVQGFGADLGINSDLYTHVDKTTLIQALFANDLSQATRQNALAVIINPLATEEDVTEALAKIKENNNQLTPIEDWIEINNPNGNLLARINEQLQKHGQTGPDFDYSVIRKLRVTENMSTGNITANDFDNIRDNLTNLVELDLEKVEIFAGNLPAGALAEMPYLEIVTLPNRNPVGANGGLNGMRTRILADNPSLDTVIFPTSIRGNLADSWFEGSNNITTLVFKFETAPTFANN